MEYPYNLLNDIGTNVEHLPDDFYPTLHYLLQTVADKRDARIVLLRYRDGLSFEDIGKEFDLSRQRTNVIVAETLTLLSSKENKEIIANGLKAYMEIALNERINQLGSLLEEDERERIAKEAYSKGYENGKKDAVAGQSMNKTDLAPVRAITVTSLPFSVRSFNCFARNNIKTLGDVIDLGDNLKDIRGFGKVCFTEIINMLMQYDVDVKSIYPRSIMKFEIKLH